MPATAAENHAKDGHTGTDANPTKPKAAPAAAAPPGARSGYYGGIDIPYPIPYGRAAARGGARGVYFCPPSLWDMMPRGAGASARGAGEAPAARYCEWGDTPRPSNYGMSSCGWRGGSAAGGSRGVYFCPPSVWDMMPRGAPPVWLAGGPEFNAEPGSYAGAESGARGPGHRGTNGTEPTKDASAVKTEPEENGARADDAEADADVSPPPPMVAFDRPPCWNCSAPAGLVFVPADAASEAGARGCGDWPPPPPMYGPYGPYGPFGCGRGAPAAPAEAGARGGCWPPPPPSMYGGGSCGPCGYGGYSSSWC
ncbi:hypothetical protein H9P43_006428 [Blastocladiella emersonii ATCC 22665]|nr:hypothetical protein H9P43_006428 [Blastocladiella emersonii ATCC 22665]